ncbi:histidine phosphatase superfamily [Talaromyces proteolyticus]|uniref:3-phytase n=1 Tax=Talaromyces proteolyticus TaxID=1131652 RepID=A0AAD4KIQ8_9EURO|nr:histidine phosphatase superfamily [Talaromyces proteolyticus]KAH8692019.1 histidine phosphatase superfamily [Talaromyces proteolyticus]
MSLLKRAVWLAASPGFNVLNHLGANSPWFSSPNINHISTEVPAGCAVDQAVYIVRHGSRYPDPGAYEEWEALYKKFQSAKYKAHGSLEFLPDWQPVVKHPEEEMSMVSLGGYYELYTFGVELRWRYPNFYTDNDPFFLWANDYPRTIDSARLFARGYMGPNATLDGTIYVVNADVPSSVGNSLATSDSCPTFHDTSGGANVTAWADIYLPPITKRLNKLIEGNLTLVDADVSLFPYLCGFETQITGSVSPWCDILSDDEILQYEYAQDMRYYYGTGPGAGKNMTVQFPLLRGIVEQLQSGPGVARAKTATNISTKLPPLIVAFTHDNQINELASILGIFDRQKPLDPKKLEDRLYVSSNITPMRGTLAFERLNCSASKQYEASKDKPYVRIRLNDAVYPIPSCHSGPGQSCSVSQYAEYVSKKWQSYGSFASVCNISAATVATSDTGAVTFFNDLTLPFLSTVQP